jgi:hypothetical protein
MTPRTGPTTTAETQAAVEELRRYGLRQQHKPSMVDVVAYWKEVRKFGLPEGATDRETVITERGGEHAEWRVYVETQGSIRMGIAESSDGARLLLLLLVSVQDMTIRQAVTETCNRL